MCIKHRYKFMHKLTVRMWNGRYWMQHPNMTDPRCYEFRCEKCGKERSVSVNWFWRGRSYREAVPASGEGTP